MILRALILVLAALNIGTALWWATHVPPPPARESPLPPGVMRLQRVDEVQPPAGRTPPAAPPPSVQAAAGDCFRIGPLDTPAVADATRARLQPLAARAVAYERPAGRVRGWRVLLPPLATAEAAEAAAERLAAAGFSDRFVVREGPDVNAVALGRFGNEAAARRHLEALRAAGFAAVAEPLGNPRMASWIELQARPGIDLAQVQAFAGGAQAQPLDCASLRGATG